MDGELDGAAARRSVGGGEVGADDVDDGPAGEDHEDHEAEEPLPPESGSWPACESSQACRMTAAAERSTVPLARLPRTPASASARPAATVLRRSSTRCTGRPSRSPTA